MLYYIASRLNDKTFPTVHIPGLDQVCLLGLDLDDYVRGLHLKAVGVHDITHQEGGVFTGSLIVMPGEFLQLPVCHAAVRQNGFDLFGARTTRMGFSL